MKRYQRGNEDVIKEWLIIQWIPKDTKEWLIIQWSKDTKGEIRRRNRRMTGIPKGKLEDVIKEWLIIQWPKDTKGEIRRHNQRMIDNTMAKR